MNMEDEWTGSRWTGENWWRKRVGGHWILIGRHQFKTMRNIFKLKPEHKMLDLGCGSFRGGRFYIKYLNPSNYYGLDYNPKLVAAGKEHEIADLIENKKPTIVVNDSFDFSQLNVDKFDIGLAQSVFTHLLEEDIRKCLANLRKYMNEGSVFVATIYRAKVPFKKLAKRSFAYSVDSIRNIAGDNWEVKSHNKIHHPRRQLWLSFTAK